MYIKLTKIYDGEMGGYDARFVKGEKLDDGTEWEKGFFSNNDDLVRQLDDFAIGDEVNVVLERNPKNKKFYNIKAFKELTDSDRERIGGTPSYASGKSTGGSYKKSAWNGRTGEAYDRSAAVYLAWEILKSTTPDTQLKKMKMERVYELAAEIDNYIHNGRMPGDKADADDPLEPPH